MLGKHIRFAFSVIDKRNAFKQAPPEPFVVDLLLSRTRVLCTSNILLLAVVILVAEALALFLITLLLG